MKCVTCSKTEAMKDDLICVDCFIKNEKATQKIRNTNKEFAKYVSDVGNIHKWITKYRNIVLPYTPKITIIEYDVPNDNLPISFDFKNEEIDKYIKNYDYMGNNSGVGLFISTTIGKCNFMLYTIMRELYLRYIEKPYSETKRIDFNIYYDRASFFVDNSNEQLLQDSPLYSADLLFLCLDFIPLAYSRERLKSLLLLRLADGKPTVFISYDSFKDTLKIFAEIKPILAGYTNTVMECV